MSDENERVSRADHQKAIQRAEAAEARAEAAEAIVCGKAIEDAAAKLGCKHPHVMVATIGKQVRMVDGIPLHHYERVADSGETVTLTQSIAEALQPHADNPLNAAMFGRKVYPQTADGNIDRNKLTVDQHMQLRKTPEGRKALGLE